MIAAGQATVAGVVPAKVAALTEGVIKSMMLTKLSKTAVAGLLALCTCGVGIGGYQATHAQEPKTTITTTTTKTTITTTSTITTPMEDDQGRDRLLFRFHDGTSADGYGYYLNKGNGVWLESTGCDFRLEETTDEYVQIIRSDGGIRVRLPLRGGEARCKIGDENWRHLFWGSWR
jgi:hypothetical protein